MRTIREWCSDVHGNAVSKGWWPETTKEEKVATIPTKLCLVHSEVSEALEDFRDGSFVTSIREDGKPEGFASELADIVIRVFDLAAALGIDLEEEIATKHAFNKKRPFKHGGKAV